MKQTEQSQGRRWAAYLYIRQVNPHITAKAVWTYIRALEGAGSLPAAIANIDRAS